MNNSTRLGKDNAIFAAALLLAVLTGFFLRWYLLKDQIGLMTANRQSAPNTPQKR
jgi:hypothetical protein